MKLLAVFLAALVMAGFASAGGSLSVHERTQNTKIRDLQRRVWADELDIRILQVCDKGDQVCADEVTQGFAQEEQR